MKKYNLKKQKSFLVCFLFLCLGLLVGCQGRQTDAAAIVCESEKMEGRPLTDAYALPEETVGIHDFDWDSEIQKIAEFQVYDDTLSVYTVSSVAPQLLLRWNGMERLFPMQLATPQGLGITPSFLDVDDDGNGELVLIQQVGSGTGISVHQLHIFENENGLLTDHILLFQAVREQLLALLEIDKTARAISLNGMTIPVPESFQPEPDMGVQIQYMCGNGLKASYGVAVESREQPGYTVTAAVLHSDITFNDGRFILSNFHLTAVA